VVQGRLSKCQNGQRIMTDSNHLADCLKSLRIEDRLYELRPRKCEECGEIQLEIWRWCGVSFSRYVLPHGSTANEFETFVEEMDENLLCKSSDMIAAFHSELCKVNSGTGIAADGSFVFRLLEYGRHRLSKLKKLGVLDALVSVEKPNNCQEEAVRAAFELGMAAAEHRMHLWAGMAMSEWREDGLPKARIERLRQGERSRSAILKAAKALCATNPDLSRNDTETARKIQQMQLPELQKGGGQQLGLDAITRHLRESRKRQSNKKNH
jgi:hypothetical protein